MLTKTFLRLYGAVIYTTILVLVASYLALADVIMMDGSGPPSIIEDDDFDQDVILMPGMSSMLINEDLVLQLPPPIQNVLDQLE